MFGRLLGTLKLNVANCLKKLMNFCINTFHPYSCKHVRIMGAYEKKIKCYEEIATVNNNIITQFIDLLYSA